MIISVGRETGAGGRELAHKLSDKLGWTYLNKDKLLKKADEIGFFEEMYEFYNEVPVSSLLQAISKNEVAASSKKNIISKIYKKLSSHGDYIVMGRCANYFLREEEGCFSVFLHANFDFKLKRLLAQGYSKSDAIDYMETSDEGRQRFHKYYTNENWGDTKNYDLCINTAFCGVDNAVKLIEDFSKLKLS